MSAGSAVHALFRRNSFDLLESALVGTGRALFIGISRVIFIFAYLAYPYPPADGGYVRPMYIILN